MIAGWGDRALFRASRDDMQASGPRSSLDLMVAYHDPWVGRMDRKIRLTRYEVLLPPVSSSGIGPRRTKTTTKVESTAYFV